jgi:hypothetical protein
MLIASRAHNTLGRYLVSNISGTGPSPSDIPWGSPSKCIVTRNIHST